MKYKIISILLTLSLLLGLTVAVPVVSTAAGSEDKVYFENTAGWEQVYCFMWDENGANKSWPGEKMTNIEDNIWSCNINSQYTNIIFDNGKSGTDNQTDNLILPGTDYIYEYETNQWYQYNSLSPRISSNILDGACFKDTLTITFSTNADYSYYTINNGDKIEFTKTSEVTIGEDDSAGSIYSISVYGENANGNTTKNFAYKKVNPTLVKCDNTYPPEFAQKDNLYAHAEENSNNIQAWQKWETATGASADRGIYYFFLPPSASDTKVEVYNTFENSIIIDNYEILPNTSAIIDYTEGKTLTVTEQGSFNAMKAQFYKSDCEASLFINDTKGTYTNYEGNEVNTDFYSFLVANKENYVKGSNCTIIDNNGINDTTLKKIKGRGNSTWRDSNKKPFNINFDSKTNIAGITNKKFSLLANAKDGSLLRNRIMYDFADEVGSSYSPDSRCVDLYFNGEYKGSYEITQKVELGKNYLVSLPDESDTLTENFNFLVEVDIWNYAGDTNFLSDNNIHVVCKSPDLEGYDGTDPTLSAQYNYIKAKYQQLENALYSGDMSDLENICDVESLARAYLLQEFGKNCDGGMTSCFFTYVADKGKFIADPIWDCDSCLGNVNCVRQNATNTAAVNGWAIRTAQYDKTTTTNVLGQAFNLSGKTSSNETFEEIVKRLWKEDFIPAISVLKGDLEAKGSKLKSIEEYKSISPKSYNLNYIKWKFQWFPYFENLGGSYPYDFDGQVNYLYDWTFARAKWMTESFENGNVVTDNNYYLTGEGFGGWGAKDYKLAKTDKGTYEISVELIKDKEYIFKIVDDNNNYYTADVSDETTGKYIVLSSKNHNATITPAEDMNVTFVFTGGSFIIKINDETPTTTPTEPVETETPTVCNHSATKTTTTAATYFAKGKTVVTCAACGKVLKTTTIAKKVLKTPTVTVKAAKKSIKVTLKKKVKNATGFVVKYQIKGKKKVYTKTYKTNKKVTKVIKKLKSGKKYTVKVKAYVKSGKKIAYSKWTKAKTVKTK
ncbi:MAG: CotH kinase family protein [Ruminococcus sp.]